MKFGSGLEICSKPGKVFPPAPNGSFRGLPKGDPAVTRQHALDAGTAEVAPRPLNSQDLEAPPVVSTAPGAGDPLLSGTPCPISKGLPMISDRTSQDRIIQLDARDGGTVTVTPTDEDRFNLRVSEAISACKKWVADAQEKQRFSMLLKRLQAWVLERSDLRDAFLTLRETGLLFLAVKKTARYDDALEDALSALDVELANDQDIRFEIDVMALPPVTEESMQSFLSPVLTLRFKSGQS